MRVSVILPIYNSEGTLEQALLSILNQNIDAFEIVAIDDGSTDGSADILNNYCRKFSRIKVITLIKNKGIVNALNVGLSESKGIWIARMDADDRMAPNRLRRQLDHLRQNPDIDLLGCQFKLFSYQSEIRTGQIRYQNWSNSLIMDAEIKRDIFIESPISHPTFFAKKQFFQNLGGYFEKEWPEDYDILLRAWLKDYKLEKLPEILLEKGDIPSRLAYNDARCSRQSMFLAKAHYFSKIKLRGDKKKIALCGTGSSAKKIALALKREQIDISFFTDDKSSENQRYFLDKPVFPFFDKKGKNLLEHSKDCFFILAIGETKGRIEVEKHFQKSGYSYQKDYLRFI